MYLLRLTRKFVLINSFLSLESFAVDVPLFQLTAVQKRAQKTGPCRNLLFLSSAKRLTLLNVNSRFHISW